MEVSKEVKTYITRLYCDKCNQEMMIDPIILNSNPPQFSYSCPQCGGKVTSYKQYTYPEYRESTKKEEPNINKNAVDADIAED